MISFEKIDGNTVFCQTSYLNDLKFNNLMKFILKLTEALLYLHYSCKLIHRNVCPQSVLINKKGSWKLAGLEFTEKCADGDLMVSLLRSDSTYAKL